MIWTHQIDDAITQIIARKPAGRRMVIGLAGAPASGKSTLAETLAERLTEQGFRAAVVPMDGYHIANDILKARDLLHRKGAPETFDVSGFTDMLGRLARDETVYYSVFDRAKDYAITAAGRVLPETEIAVVEGNYLLLNEPDWAELGSRWDLSLSLDVPLPILRDRLIERWEGFGMTREAAKARADQNDIPNAERVIAQSRPANIRITFGTNNDGASPT
jgi:pantothenate kinase